MPHTIAMIVAAGESRRMGGQTPKPYRMLAGKPMLRWSAETLLSHPEIGGVMVVIHPQHRALYDAATAGLTLLPPVHGGASRQDSVREGLLSLKKQPPSLVLIHDAARPLVSHALIDQVLAGLKTHAAAVPGLPVPDTLKRMDEEGEVEATVSRERLFAVQTPQGFDYQAILTAHLEFEDMELTDDAAVAEHAEIAVKMVEGDPHNFKITYPYDWQQAEAMLGREKVTVTAMGFDIHRLVQRIPGEVSAVRLGGVDIPCTHALEGHSDADAVLHALTDAILGTIAEGDIGEHFPPSDPQWKGASSDVFVHHALRLLEGKGGKLLHADITLLCELPKISPYRDAMRASIAALTGLPLARVSVKATTMEGLGSIGRAEGIAAQAVVTIVI